MGQSLASIPVCYSERMLAETASFSPSAGKPRHVLAAWQREQLPMSLHVAQPVEPIDLHLAHDPAYVSGILTGTVANGFGNKSPAVARSLPYTSGAMLGAARLALDTGCACAPVSGFHHANYDSSGGFCTFNGLIVAARKLITEGLVNRVLIVDCDMHYGDGTDQIVKKLGLRESITNVTFGRWFHEPQQAAAYLDRLRDVTATFKDFELVLYQAGADVHVDDPLGGVLSTDDMIERDRRVFDTARSTGTPIAWNLAGGYQEPLERVIALHVNTMRECVDAFGSKESLGGSIET
jgi:acetoin utilization deacetylase AcuC-like enzyme